MGMVYKSRLRVEFHHRQEEVPMAHGTYLNKRFPPHSYADFAGTDILFPESLYVPRCPYMPVN